MAVNGYQVQVVRESLIMTARASLAALQSTMTHHGAPCQALMQGLGLTVFTAAQVTVPKLTGLIRGFCKTIRSALGRPSHSVLSLSSTREPVTLDARLAITPLPGAPMTAFTKVFGAPAGRTV